MSEKTQDLIGRVLDDTDGHRDAIHIAVEPVLAGEKLSPGQDIGFVEGSTTLTSATGKHIGIVDPFLKGIVFKGQKFWMFLYPNTITSLRHVWTHPAFAETEQITDKATSEAWLRSFIGSADCPGYETVLAAAVGQFGSDPDYVTTGYLDSDYLHFNGMDAHGDIPPEFWDHIEIVTGKKMRQRPAHFSCSC